jgi:hypothetical protein
MSYSHTLEECIDGFNKLGYFMFSRNNEEKYEIDEMQMKFIEYLYVNKISYKFYVKKYEFLGAEFEHSRYERVDNV